MSRGIDSAPDRHLDELLIRVATARSACGLSSVDSYIEAAETARDCGAFDLMVQALLRDLRLGDDERSANDLWPLRDPRIEPLLEEALAALPSGEFALRACVLARLSDRSPLPASGQAGDALDPHVAAEEQRPLLAEAERIARASGSRPAIAYVLHWAEWMHHRDPKGAERELAAADEIIAIGESLGDRSLARIGHMWRAFSFMRLGDPRMDDDLQAFHQASCEFNIPHPLRFSSVCVAMRSLMLGEFAQAERQIMEANSIGQRILEEEGRDTTGALAQQMYQLRFDQGRVSELEPLLRAQADQDPDGPAWRIAFALAYTSMDRFEDARREYQQVMRDGIDVWRRSQYYDFALPFGAEVCAALGDAAHAGELYEHVLPYAGTLIDIGWRTSRGSADRYLGLLAATLGRFDDAQRHFEDALTITARIGARPWLARTQLDYARMLIERDAAGDQTKARDLLQRALATAHEIGMAKVAVDAERELRAVATNPNEQQPGN